MLPISIPAQSITQCSKSHHQGDNRFCFCAFLCVYWYEFCVRVPETIDGETIFIRSQNKIRLALLSHYLTVHVFLLITDKHTDWWQQMLFRLCSLFFKVYSINQLYFHTQAQRALNNTARISPLLHSSMQNMNAFCFCWHLAPVGEESETAGRPQVRSLWPLSSSMSNRRNTEEFTADTVKQNR